MAADLSSYNAATSYANQSYPKQAWVSINSDHIAPQVHAKLIKRYGHLIGLFDYANMPQNRIYVKNHDYTIWSKWSSQRAIRIASAVATGSAGADIEIVMHSSMKDDNGNFPVRQYFDIIIPGKYQTSGYTRIYNVVSVSTTTLDNDTLTCRPYSASGTYITEAQIGTQIPADTYLITGGSAFAPGTPQPTSMIESYTSEIFRCRILKETWGVEGGFGAGSYYEPIEFDLLGGGSGITNAEIIRAEVRLMEQIDKYFHTGELNDNSNLVGTSTLGGSNVVVSGKGFDSAVDEDGLALPYIDNPSFEDFSDLGRLAETQGMAPLTWDAYLGTELARKFGDLDKEIIKDYSGGSDLLDATKKRLGVNISKVNWGNTCVYFHTLGSSGDASSYGVRTSGTYTYDYPEKGYFVPQEMNEVDIKGGMYQQMDSDGNMNDMMGKALLPNLTVAYVNAGGENRERFGGKLVGPNGFGLGDGYVASEYDAVKGFVNSHCGLIITNANHIVKMYNNA